MTLYIHFQEIKIEMNTVKFVCWIFEYGAMEKKLYYF
jgi:hypothetical protein